MKRIAILFVLAALFVLTPRDSFAQKKPKAKPDPTLRPSKSQKKVKKKMAKRRSRSAFIVPAKTLAIFWRKDFSDFYWKSEEA
jgi:hypothetical protein